MPTHDDVMRGIEYMAPFYTHAKDVVIRVDPGGHKILVCPECADHELRSISYYHDCKNEIVTARQNEETGEWYIHTTCQCQCSGPEHDLRDEQKRWLESGFFTEEDLKKW
jgi:hypothetical protein